MTVASDYRQIAAECQRQAETSIAPHEKQQWLRLTERWLKLAEAIDQFEAD